MEPQRGDGKGGEAGGNETVVLEVLNRWDTIRGFPKAKYEGLAGRILSALRRGLSGGELEALILNDMQFYLGIDVPESEVRRVRREIMTWWRGGSASAEKPKINSR
jgi:hypothetical protein